MRLTVLTIALPLSMFVGYALAGNPSPCPQGTVVFQCDAQGGKQIVMCASHDARGDLQGLQYRYGRPDSPELVYPKRLEQSLAPFKGNHYFRAQTDYAQVSFTRGPYVYSVYSNYDGEAGDPDRWRQR
jgi:hypothetical protein